MPTSGRWLQRFHDAITALHPQSQHVAIGVNAAPAGEALPSWHDAGFDRIDTAVLRLLPGALRAPQRLPRGDLRFAPLDLRNDAEAIVALESADAGGFERAAYIDYRQRALQRYAAMADAAAAAWFGVWCDGVLGASCGLVRDGPHGRFQHVGTHPALRRRGLCSALVHGVSAWGFAHWRLHDVLMCADPHDVAIGIYEALGYQRIDADWCLQRNARRDAGARRPPA